jgi:hypothetical protein
MTAKHSKFFRLIFSCSLCFFSFNVAHAQLKFPSDSYLISQSGSEDAYDPFADYSEFEEASDEEADINFFRNGRFLTIGLLFGPRVFTQTLGQLNATGANYGGYISFFFDLRFAIQVLYLMGDHAWSLDTATKQYRATNSLSNIEFDIKYYFNTQNVTRGLAKINPYLLIGVGQIYRTLRFSDAQGFTRDGGTGFNFGAGVEFPIMRNKMFIGADAVYQYVNFPDEFNNYDAGDGSKTGVFPKGDTVRFLGTIGFNF